MVALFFSSSETFKDAQLLRFNFILFFMLIVFMSMLIFVTSEYKVPKIVNNQIIPRSMVCSEGSVGIPQNMMLVSMVHSSREKQQDTRCTRVKVLQGGRLMTENQMWPSRKSLAVFMKNRLLEIIVKNYQDGLKVNTDLE